MTDTTEQEYEAWFESKIRRTDYGTFTPNPREAWQAAHARYAPRWISANDKPKSGQSVFVSYTNKLGNRRVVVGQYIARYSVEANGELDQNDEYCEEQDCYFLCEGWCENQDNWDEYTSIFIHDHEVDLWMPLILPSVDEAKALIATKEPQ